MRVCILYAVYAAKCALFTCTDLYINRLCSALWLTYYIYECCHWPTVKIEIFVSFYFFANSKKLNHKCANKHLRCIFPSCIKEQKVSTANDMQVYDCIDCVRKLASMTTFWLLPSRKQPVKDGKMLCFISLLGEYSIWWCFT